MSHKVIQSMKPYGALGIFHSMTPTIESEHTNAPIFSRVRPVINIPKLQRILDDDSPTWVKS